MNMIKVSAASRTSAVAGAMAGVVREQQRAEIQAIGVGSAPGMPSCASSGAPCAIFCARAISRAAMEVTSFCS